MPSLKLLSAFLLLLSVFSSYDNKTRLINNNNNNNNNTREKKWVARSSFEFIDKLEGDQHEYKCGLKEKLSGCITIRGLIMAY